MHSGGIFGRLCKTILLREARLHLSAGSAPAGTGPHLRARRCAALRIARHAAPDLDPFSRIMLGTHDTLERMAGGTAEKILFLFFRSRHAHQPLTVRKLPGQILCLAYLQIECGARLSFDFYLSWIL